MLYFFSYKLDIGNNLYMSVLIFVVQDQGKSLIRQ